MADFDDEVKNMENEGLDKGDEMAKKRLHTDKGNEQPDKSA